MRIAINGLGRIGRQITRQILVSKPDNIDLVAINSLEPLDTAAHLLKYDSSHGIFHKKINTNGTALAVDDTSVFYYSQSDPSTLPWNDLNIDTVVECSGNFIKHDKASLHLNSGAAKVLITAAAVNPDITLCMGVNHNIYNPSIHHIISGSSCTTNCIAPVLQLIGHNYEIVSCLASILHSYTNSQNLLDSFNSDLRRARAAGKSILPTTTSAADQIPIVIPSLKNKFDALAIRVPTPDVHLADLTIKTSEIIESNHLSKVLRHGMTNTLKGILKISEEPLVSSDMIGSPYSSIIDAPSLTVCGNIVKILIWHDNEFSYCRRMVDLLAHIADSQPPE